ncbi:MAG: PAS domain S-box protein [Bacteroidales bacterium]|nr:PAS domain S-box protein [Bacteroidales bacterium]
MKKILVIDDQQDNLMTIKAIIKNHLPDCKIITALSGKVGVDIVKKEQPDTILLDIIMPQMDGFEICQRIKTSELTKHIPVVMMTDIKAIAESRAKSLNAGADAFISKPINPIELIAQINLMLRIKEAEDKLRSEKEILEEVVLTRTIELRKGEEKYKALYDKTQHYLDIARVIMVALDSNGNVTLINKKACEILEFNESDIIGKNWFDNFLLKDELNVVKNTFDKIINGELKQVEYFKNKIVTKNGNIREIAWYNSIIKDESGIITGTLSSGEDITEYKKTETKLVESQKRYQSLFEHSPIPIWEEEFSDIKKYFDSLTKKGVKDFREFFDKYPKEVLHCASLVKILDVNKTSLTFFDVKNKTELIKKLPEYFNEDSLVVFKEELIALASGKNKFESEIPIIDLSGKIRNLILKLTVCPGYEKSLAKVFVSFIDITKRKEAELKIKQQTEDLKLINKLNESVRAGDNLKELIYFFSNETRKIFDCLSATAYLLDSEKKNMVLQNITLSDSLQNSMKEYMGIKIPEIIIPFVPGSFYFEKLKNNSPKIYNDTTIAQKLIEANVQTTSIKNETLRKTIKKAIPALQKLLKIKSYIMVPLTANNELSGFVGFSGTNIFSDNELERITRIVSSFNTIINKKIIDENLKKSEANLKALIENRNESIWSTDKNNNYVIFNKFFSEAYQRTYNVKLKPGLNASEILTPKLQKFWKEKYEIAIKGNKVRFEFNEIIQGQLNYFEVNLNPIFSGNEITGVSALAVNITDQKFANIKLKEAELRFRSIFEQAQDAIVLLDTETKGFSEFNDITCKMLGYTRKEFSKLKIFDFETIENIEETEKRIKKVLKVGFDTFETKMRRKNGEIIDVNVSVRKIIVERKVYLLNIWRDITEQKQSIERIKKSEEKFKLLADHTFEWEYWIAPNGNYNFISQSCEKISGLKPEQYSDNPQLFFDIIHPDYKNEISKHFNDEHRENNKQFSKEFIIIKPDGNELWIEHNCNPVFDSKGVYQGRRGVNRDITERKKTELELIESHKKLVDLTAHIEEVREKERSKIALDLHDDLGQKLTALNMDLSWLEKKLDKNNPDLTNKFESMSNLLSDTLKSVKTISTELRPSILDDLGLIAAVEWLLSEFSENTGILCSSNLISDDSEIEVDVSIIVFRMIQEALTNVARHANATKLELSADKIDGMLQIIISDNGKGISIEEIESSDSFGLQGIKERAKSCDGNVKIIGEPNKGTKIIINLPLNI